MADAEVISYIKFYFLIIMNRFFTKFKTNNTLQTRYTLIYAIVIYADDIRS